MNQIGRVTFTQIWDAVSTEFPNSLTSDSTSILDALKIYARQVSGGYWMLKPEIRQRVNQHSEVIVILAVIGKSRGYDIWIGKREQSEKDNGLVARGKTLREYMTVNQLRVNNAENQEVIEQIDLIWMEDDKIKAIFEVESTTGMTSALMRGSNVDKAVDKFMVIPGEREPEFRNKTTSPLFKEHFENENWKLIYFDKLRQTFSQEKNKTDIYKLINQHPLPTSAKKGKGLCSEQGRLF